MNVSRGRPVSTEREPGGGSLSRIAAASPAGPEWRNEELGGVAMMILSGRRAGVDANVLVLGTAIAVAAASADLAAQAIQPPGPVRTYGGGVAPEEIPDAFRSRIYRSSGEETPVPDVLVLKNGRKIEAYFLQAYANRLVFYFKENARSFVREEIPRSMVASVLYGQYLDRDPNEPRLIERARKQPVPKKDVLAGRYRGAQDRFTTWRAVFHSETNKPLPYAEDATEYGTFVIESGRALPSGYANETWSMGRYSLFAPKTVNNEEWVLELTEVTHSERDRTDHVSWFSGAIQDDILIVEFSPHGGFRLHWSNLSAGAWTTLPQVEFHPAGGPGGRAGRGAPARIRPSIPVGGGRLHLVSAQNAEAPIEVRSLAASASTAGPASESAARAWVLGLTDATPAESHRRAFLAVRLRKPGTRVEGWGPPNSLWDR